MTVHINRLREKLEQEPEMSQLIETVWGQDTGSGFDKRHFVSFVVGRLGYFDDGCLDFFYGLSGYGREAP